jgi:methylmalonyl-CoA mutase N-terminal domain/subunit
VIRAVSVHAWRAAHDVSAVVCGPCASIAGFGTAKATNTRFRLLLDAGQTGLSVAFDLPTQMGIDSDSPRALGEVGRVGVAIDTVEDLHVLLDGIPLDKVSTSMTINATASTLPGDVYRGRRGTWHRPAVLSGTVQNDILKEYIARGTYIYPPGPSLALTAEMFRFRSSRSAAVESDFHFGLSHPRSRRDGRAGSGVHVRRRRSRTCSRPVDAGFRSIAFAPRLSFFFAAHSDLFEEVASSVAARRLWARIMRERFRRERQQLPLRFHTQTGGVTLTAQQPLNNVVRVTVQALAAALGGTQSLHTNGYDEALALPTAMQLRSRCVRSRSWVRIGRRADGRSAGRQLVRGATHRHGRSARASS